MLSFYYITYSFEHFLNLYNGNILSLGKVKKFRNLKWDEA